MASTKSDKSLENLKRGKRFSKDYQPTKHGRTRRVDKRTIEIWLGRTVAQSVKDKVLAEHEQLALSDDTCYADVIALKLLQIVTSDKSKDSDKINSARLLFEYAGLAKGERDEPLNIALANVDTLSAQQLEDEVQRLNDELERSRTSSISPAIIVAQEDSARDTAQAQSES